ncbi:hypothetical protein HELRODRAFT_174841 [Helobdella robusta]|uniref:SUEL-type lectin domain-containing protein n=1 Tax=Helobdella robusta TaxID=6412 RepID=T1F8J1_HELRO|nr:hypothetical protein HELRODRAFT_174841 [Helobdella robusta]ESO01291.1 hypothetical protein HELRODRAFT_174841 [Helobdella robusta]
MPNFKPAPPTNSTRPHHYNKKPFPKIYKDGVLATSGHVIIIRSANYGRMHIGKCATKNYGDVGCQHDVTNHVTSACSGLDSCKVYVPDDWLKSLQPCPKDFAPFLVVSYRCLPESIYTFDLQGKTIRRK